MIGRHCIRTWSSTQPSVTLSSGEAEYYGLVKAAGAGLGHQSLMQDLRLKLPVTVWTDSSAAIGIASRSGLGKLRHLETHTLWVQEKVRTGAIAVKKVNPADLFTKHVASREKVHQLLGRFGCEYRQGRAQAAPLLRPMDSDDRQGGHSIEGDMLPAYSAEIEAELHDAGRLPHLHSEAESDLRGRVAASGSRPCLRRRVAAEGSAFGLRGRVTAGERRCGEESRDGDSPGWKQKERAKPRQSQVTAW